jgi:hypothetical protein
MYFERNVKTVRSQRPAGTVQLLDQLPRCVLLLADMQSKCSERSHTREGEAVSDGEMLCPPTTPKHSKFHV